MKFQATLLLNLAVLLVNVFVSWGTTETQTRVLRTTARVAHSFPLPVRKPAVEPAPTCVPRAGLARLMSYLARLEDLDRLTTAQVEALLEAHEHCAAEIARGAAALRAGRRDGVHTRVHAGGVRERARRHAAGLLKAASLPEGELMDRLVRVVLACSG